VSQDAPSGANSVPPPLPQQVIPYATPFGRGRELQGVWRDGNRLITTSQASLPPRCVKCNAEADGSFKFRTFWWHHPALALLILAGILIYAIVALIVRKKAVVEVGLCRRHQSRRVWLISLTWLMALGGLALMIGGPILAAEFRKDWLIGVGLPGGLVMLILSIIPGTLSRVMVPTKIDDRYAWFKGCGVEFLSQFPPAR
jgi:hypothetical protein